MTRKLLPVLMLMVVLSPLAIDIYLPSMPQMAVEFSVSDTQVQSTLVLFILAMGIGQILIGPLADRFGRRPIALFGILLYWRESKSNKKNKFFNKLFYSKELQMKSGSKKGFLYQQSFLMRLVYLGSLYLLAILIIQF